MDNNDLLAKLKLIGKLKKDDKLNTKKLFIQSDNIISKISRSLIFVDDRENLLNFIINTVDKCFDLLESKNSRQETILEDLKLALEGIKNIKLTYSEDLYFCCKLDVLIEEIESKIQKSAK